MSDITAVSVRGLTKRYRDTVAVDDLSFEVPAGSVFAFLGANGAGKSTTIGCVTSVLPFDAGRIEVDGHDVRHDGDAVRSRIGVVFQDSILDSALTVRENLSTRARAYGYTGARLAQRVAELAELVQVGDLLERRYGRLSGGQRRRVDIARALLHDPAILFLDEPTAGLDPASRATIWRSVHELRGRSGLTVFLTTHYMEETEEADDVCILDHGRIVAQGTPAQLRAQHSASVLTLTTAAGTEQRTVAGADQARRILAELGDEILDFEFRHGRMDDVFLALTHKTAEEGRA